MVRLQSTIPFEKHVFSKKINLGRVWSATEYYRLIYTAFRQGINFSSQHPAIKKYGL